MELTRINPVTLITGATRGVGAACARALARRSEGGLILIDADGRALDALADEIEAPERVSLLAFDITDADRWAQASSFIHSQYGLLDWAIVDGEAPAANSDLVDWGRGTDLNGAFLTLRTVMPLMAANKRGGAIVVSAPALPKPQTGLRPKPGVLEFIRAASNEGGPDVRVNAITPGADASLLKQAPWFAELVKQAGGERAAFALISARNPPLARYAGADDVMPLIAMLLSDESSITGATLIVDGGYVL